MSSRTRMCRLEIWYICRECVSTVLFRDQWIWLDCCAASRERRTFMCKPIKILLLVLLLVGSTSYADARSGHGGFHGGRHGGFRGGGYGHRHFVPGHRFGHSHGFHSHFHGGVFFDVSPFWIAPAPYTPYIGVTPAPPPPPAPVWYYCTDPPGYYPIVPECMVPWTPVAPPG
jgi:hypothetical protein